MDKYLTMLPSSALILPGLVAVTLDWGAPEKELSLFLTSPSGFGASIDLTFSGNFLAHLEPNQRFFYYFQKNQE